MTIQPHTTQASNEPNGDAPGTPLEISQAVLEGEENPNTARAITPLERAASGTPAHPEARSARPSAARCIALAVAWGGAALVSGLGSIGLGLMRAARRLGVGKRSDALLFEGAAAVQGACHEGPAVEVAVLEGLAFVQGS